MEAVIPRGVVTVVEPEWEKPPEPAVVEPVCETLAPRPVETEAERLALAPPPVETAAEWLTLAPPPTATDPERLAEAVIPPPVVTVVEPEWEKPPRPAEVEPE